MLKSTYDETEQANPDIQQKMLLTEYSLKYIVPLLIIKTPELQKTILDALYNDEKLLKEFKNHLSVYSGKKL